MESFALIKNELIKNTDARSVVYGQPKPLKNTLKTLVKTSTKDSFTTNTLYSSKFTMEIPRSAYDNLSQLYIKATLSTAVSGTPTASTVETYLATKIFKQIRFRTKRGTILQYITPSYSSMRIDETINTPLNTFLSNSIEPDIAFADGDPSVIVPLFLFFSEDQYSFLNTRNLEQLELELTVNDSKESMGMEVDLTSAIFELYSLFHDTNESNANSDFYYTKKPGVQRSLVGSYNMFEEDDLVCPQSSTSAKLLLRCPHPLFVLHMSLIDENTNRAQIKTVKITVGSRVMMEFDYRMNYQMYGHQRAFLENGTVSLYFSKLRERCYDSGLITFSKEMYPAYLEITYDSLPADYTLHSFEEYRTNYTIDDIGQISLSDDVKNSYEGQDQGNSYAPTTFVSMTG